MIAGACTTITHSTIFFLFLLGFGFFSGYFNETGFDEID
jgi:hypothetical protein